MTLRLKLLAFVTVAFVLALSVTASHAKGILEILRDKGVITEAEYRQAVEEARGEKKKTVEEAKSTVQKASRIPDWLEHLKFYGDTRFREEGFLNSAINSSTKSTRWRTRIRARLGLKADFGDELKGGLRIATGNSNDPISTNQTLGGVFSNKSINLDQAYITVAPWQTFGLEKVTGKEKPIYSITGGKFSVPFFKPGGSELIFDGDLTPEGISEELTLWEQHDGFFRNFSLTGAQWSTQEVSSGSDGWMFGAQGTAEFVPVSGTKLTLMMGDYGFQRVNYLATAANSNSSLVITNGVNCANGTSFRGGKNNASACSGAGSTIASFKGGFNLLSWGAQLDVATPWEAFPLSLYADFVNNLDADTGADTGYWLGFNIGKSKKKGDFKFSYTFGHVQTEAVLSEFSYSDFGVQGGTNVMGNFIQVQYKLFDHLTLSAKNHFVNYITRPVGYHNPTQSRLQLDMILTY